MKFNGQDWLGRPATFRSASDLYSAHVADPSEMMDFLGRLLDTLADKGVLNGSEVIRIVRGYDDKDIEVVE